MPDRAPAARILGTGHYLPEQVVTNDDLAQRMDTSDEWIRTRTGIGQRHIAAPEQATSDLAVGAARRALEAANTAPNELDLILVGTISPDTPFPAAAVYVQQKLGITTDCPSLDISAACAGFVYGLGIADAFVRAGQAKRVLVVGVELLSRIVDWEDRSTCVLFGDGAGAVVIGPSEGDGRGILSTHMYADGSQASALHIPGGGSRTPFSQEVLDQRLHLVHMQGREVFKFAVKALGQATQIAMESNGLSPEEIDWVMPHQANTRIIEAVKQRSGIAAERFMINIDTTANTSSASVPILLDQAARAGRLSEGQNILMCALGGGFAWGSALVRW